MINLINTMNTININDLKQQCPLPELMRRIGLGKYAKSSCCSPFRNDSKPSWGIFQYGGHWMYKDHATGEVGDEIDLLVNLHHLDARKDFVKLLDLYGTIASQPAPVIKTWGKETQPSNERPDFASFHAGTYEQLQRLSNLRGISLAGVQLAQDRNVLIFGDWHGLEVYGVRDVSGRLGEIRRLSGELFPAYNSMPAHKSHTLKHSQKNWCLGVMEAQDKEAVVLVEGLPDFIALHQFLADEDPNKQVGPVAMLGAAGSITDEALPYFKSKHVRICPHLDDAGLQAAARWQEQLIKAHVKRVDFFNFRAFEITAGNSIKDLCDFNQQRGLAGLNQQQILENII
jgi:hypothetical protein